MRKSLAIVLAVLLVGAVVVAQSHNNTAEKKASDEITFKVDTKVGTHLLKAGRYKVACDTKTVVFSLISPDVREGGFSTLKKVLEVPCDGKELSAKSEHTEMSLPVKDGVAILETLTLLGGNVAHAFVN